jgi:hypothetical protein
MQFGTKDKWSDLHIYVFANRAAAQRFARYQSKRQNRLLRPQDYQNLHTLWRDTLTRYSYSAGTEEAKYPTYNPNSWWR